MDYQFLKSKENTNLKKLSNSICLILSEEDALNIQNKSIYALGIGLKSIIKSISNNNYIKTVTIGVVKVTKTKNKAKIIRSTNLIKRFSIKISLLIDLLDSKLNEYNINETKDIDSDLINSFYQKIKGDIILEQVKDGYFSETTISQKSLLEINEDFDFFIRGSGLYIEKGEILDKYSKLGVLSLHHADNSLNRGGPVGFWEVKYKFNSGITAQILTKELDNGKVIYKARLRTINNPTINRLNIYKHTHSTLTIAISRLYNQDLIRSYIDKENIIEIIQPYFREIFRMPNIIEQLRVSLGCFAKSIVIQPERVIKKFLSLFFNPYDKWGVALTNDTKLRVDRWTHIKTKKNKHIIENNWHADPFIARVNNRLFLLTEKFLYRERKGVIWSHEISVSNKNISIIRDSLLLKNSYHLSYPFTFERDGNSYMIPENNYNKCYLYKLFIKEDSNNELGVIRIRNLFNGNGIDPTLIRDKGIDYLFISSLNEKSDSILHVFFSRDIVKKEIVKHPFSPLVVDHTYGRSAGRIYKDKITEKIIRSSQINEGGYGRGIAFSELYLSPEVIVINPLKKEIYVPRGNCNYSKTHHMEVYENITAMDYS